MSRHRALAPALFFGVLAALLCGAANAQVAKDGDCADNAGVFPAKCIKEIRIWNNTPRKIYVVLQAGKQLHVAHNCPEGDIWLQAALGDRSKCYKVTQDYHVYVNPETGIPANTYVSIKVPFWSKRSAPTHDLYIDWWRGGRVVIFDDKTALEDTYLKLKGRPQVGFISGSPKPSCSGTVNNTCKAGELQIYQVPPAAQIAQHTPFQLNEFTFADVTALQDGGKLVSLNQNYNVSNVDQLYLPIAIEPLRNPADVPYMGTIMSVAEFRNRLLSFTGDPNDPNNLKWPVHNNPVTNGNVHYPDAGIRVPSPLAIFNYYMNPSTFPSGEPEMIPANPPDLIRNMMDQWRDCTTGAVTCPDEEVYRQINDVFVKNYAVYWDKCSKGAPDYLKQISGTNKPKLTTFLRFVHGWVPFNTACAGVPELPTVDEGSRITIDYIHLQYNYMTRARARWFNPYTQLVHGLKKDDGLDANAYAFSIDDQASFQNNSGSGLIIAVGGAKGLVNGTQMPPPIPEYHRLWDFSVSLGAAAKNGAQWDHYGICSETADKKFPPTNAGYVIGVDPSFQRISPDSPCKITLTDTKNRKYRLVVKQAKVPPHPIWPAFKPGGPGGNFDKNVISCPQLDGFVPPDQWCNHTNETAKPASAPGGPAYELGIRSPLP